MPVIDHRDESGFTMLATTIAMAVVMLLAVVAVTAVNGDSHLSRRDLDQKKAFEAAKAGIDDYAYHLSADSGYWSKCEGEAKENNAVNQEGSTKKRRAVPGGSGATYAIELLPATGQKKCDPSSIPAATESMIESSTAPLPGSFRIRSNGFAGEAHSSLVATFKPPSFLNYVYFTQRETLDPVTYGFSSGSEAAEAAKKQCNLTWQEGRYDQKFKYSDGEGGYIEKECSKISFVTGDVIKGPLHTNDAISIDGFPVFGRTPQDQIEVGAEENFEVMPPKRGWYPYSEGSKPTFVGSYKSSAGFLVAPKSNKELEYIVEPKYHFFGQVKICLNEETMTVGNEGSCTGLFSGMIPSNGVVYVSNSKVSSEKCGELYSPFTAEYSAISGCGNVYVEGKYSGQLTIAAENNVIINGDLERTNQSAMLGLIANNFIRLYHPCKGGKNGSDSLENPTVDAAMLAINHSIIVDHYDCGPKLGTLSIEGALAQYFRGPVGTGGGSGTGYLKNYVYDDRLRYQEPPHFIEPLTGSWVIGRETIG